MAEHMVCFFKIRNNGIENFFPFLDVLRGNKIYELCYQQFLFAQVGHPVDSHDQSCNEVLELFRIR